MTQWKPKQLEWEGLEAKTELGIYYYLEQYKDGDYHAFYCAANTEPLDRYETGKEAKAACQADFERRWQVTGEQFESVENLIDEIDCLKSELDCAIETAFNRGAHEWVKLNYPKHYEKLSLNAKHVSEPQPFWKPIEQCPKEKGKKYLLRHNFYDEVVGQYIEPLERFSIFKNSTFNECAFTHYAEIPPLEASNAKV